MHPVRSDRAMSELRIKCAQMDLIDSARARKCLADKYVVMLGDSTMSETMHDLVMLLSGVAVNDTAMKEYMANGTR